MVQKTKIEWVAQFKEDGSIIAGYTTNPIYAVDIVTNKRGWFCIKCSAGCLHCYSETINKMWGNGLEYSQRNLSKIKWVLNEKELDSIRNLKSPSVLFPCDMTDLFLEAIPDEMIGRFFDVMEECPQHIFKLLTKRTERMRQFVSNRYKGGAAPSHIWFGTSVENQKAVDERVPILLNINASILFLSCEPLLEEINLAGALNDCRCGECDYCNEVAYHPTRSVDWVICGAESGRGARAMDEEWARDLKDQCVEAGVPFFLKQFASKGKKVSLPVLDGCQWTEYPTLPCQVQQESISSKPQCQEA